MELRGVSKRYRTPAGIVEALAAIDLSVGTADFIGVTGASGSGKSTLLHILSLLERPSSGSVRFGGQVVDGLDDNAQSRIRGEEVGLVFQAPTLLRHRTALENVALRFRYLCRERGEIERASIAALRMVGLGDRLHRIARLLSGGEQQRVALARAIAWPPRLLLADEPTGNLDSHASGEVLELLHALHRQGQAIILVTHQHAMLRHCTRVIELFDGRCG